MDSGQLASWLSLQAIDGIGDRSDDIIFANNRNNRLVGGWGNDALFGEGGEDLMLGGAGNDFLAGGKKNDTLHTGSGYNLVAFNRNDGDDVIVAGAGAVNTLSLGGGIAIDDIALRRNRNDLILDLGQRDAVTLRDWYAGAGHRHLTTLQVIEAAQGGKGSPTVHRIDFEALAGRFDAESRGASATSPWALTAQRLAAHLSTGTLAAGGDLALEYAARGRFELPATAVADALYRLDPAHAGQRLVAGEPHHA